MRFRSPLLTQCRAHHKNNHNQTHNMFDYPNIQISVKNKVSPLDISRYASRLILYFFLEICKFVLVIIFVMGSRPYGHFFLFLRVMKCFTSPSTLPSQCRSYLVADLWSVPYRHCNFGSGRIKNRQNTISALGRLIRKANQVSPFRNFRIKGC